METGAHRASTDPKHHFVKLGGRFTLAPGAWIREFYPSEPRYPVARLAYDWLDTNHPSRVNGLKDDK